jgi:hypothetical protein
MCNSLTIVPTTVATGVAETTRDHDSGSGVENTAMMVYEIC